MEEKKLNLTDEKPRRFSELCDEGCLVREHAIHLREDSIPSPARRRNRLFYISFIVSALLLAAALFIVAKIYLDS